MERTMKTPEWFAMCVVALGAALLLVTGIAHAFDKYSAPVRDRFDENGEMRPEIDADFNCDRLPKYYLGGHFSQQHTTKDVTLNFEVGFSNNRERSLPGRRLSFDTIREPASYGSTA